MSFFHICLLELFWIWNYKGGINAFKYQQKHVRISGDYEGCGMNEIENNNSDQGYIVNKTRVLSLYQHRDSEKGRGGDLEVLYATKNSERPKKVGIKSDLDSEEARKGLLIIEKEDSVMIDMADKSSEYKDKNEIGEESNFESHDVTANEPINDENLEMNMDSLSDDLIYVQPDRYHDSTESAYSRMNRNNNIKVSFKGDIIENKNVDSNLVRGGVPEYSLDEIDDSVKYPEQKRYESSRYPSVSREAYGNRKSNSGRRSQWNEDADRQSENYRTTNQLSLHERSDPGSRYYERVSHRKETNNNPRRGNIVRRSVDWRWGLSLPEAIHSIPERIASGVFFVDMKAKSDGETDKETDDNNGKLEYYLLDNVYQEAISIHGADHRIRERIERAYKSLREEAEGCYIRHVTLTKAAERHGIPFVDSLPVVRKYIFDGTLLLQVALFKMHKHHILEEKLGASKRWARYLMEDIGLSSEHVERLPSALRVERTSFMDSLYASHVGEHPRDRFKFSTSNSSTIMRNNRSRFSTE